jgi:dipeptidyl aminopeptidase/acylaminoacyl peptidase
MPMLRRLWKLGGVLTWTGIAIASAAAQTSALPAIEEFMRPPVFSRPALSPDGRRLAMLATGKDGRKQLAVIETTDPAKGRVVASFADADIESFHWISDDRLVFQATDLTSGGGDQLAPGLFAVDADGSDYRQLVDRTWRGVAARRVGDRTLPWYTFFLSAAVQRDSDAVFVQQADYSRYRPGDEPPATTVLRLDTRTGESANLSLGAPTGPGSWLIDGSGQPRVRVIPRGGQILVHYRDPKDGIWRVIADYPQTGGEGFLPVRANRDGSLLVVATNGKDTRALYRYEPAERLLSEPALVRVAGFDFDGQIVWDGPSERLLGVHVNADGAGTVWLDARLKEAQARIDAQLPATVNRVSAPLRPAVPLLLVESYADTQPPLYALYNTESRTLTRIARSRPGIDPRQMGRMDFVRIKARDGLELPVYYTLPPAAFGSKGLPTVVLIHGGPWVRGSRWGWDAQAQLLASRGYLVIEPEFRGSDGYGFRHMMAGWKQWGRAMQDDITDAVDWAVRQGLADSRRVCAAGASYGGYATLMALAREPERFRCGIAWVAVTDIDLLFTAAWTDVSDGARRYGLRTMIGDPEKDAAQLQAASPTANAARIVQPLILAYGGADLRVPIEHGRKFRDLVTRSNPQVEWIVYGDEGHSWVKLQTQVDFWSRVEKFLAGHIGTAAAK